MPVTLLWSWGCVGWALCPCSASGLLKPPESRGKGELLGSFSGHAEVIPGVFPVFSRGEARGKAAACTLGAPRAAAGT